MSRANAARTRPPGDSNANPSAAPQATAAPNKQREMLVLDTTATEGPRTHELIVDGLPKPFTFERGKPLALPPAIALKFLRHEAFRLVNEQGEVLPFQRRPKQPEELGAGEKLTLAANETIARYDELSTWALVQRAVELPGGERFAAGPNKPDRAAMIEFIIAASAERKAQNAAKQRDIGEDDFVPEAETGEDESERRAGDGEI